MADCCSALCGSGRSNSLEMDLWSADKLKETEIGEHFEGFESLIKDRHFQSYIQLCCKRLYLGLGPPTDLFIAFL